MFTIPATAPKQGTIGGPEADSAAAVSDSYKSLFHWALNRHLKSAGNNVDIVSANPNKFQSVVRQAHRSNEKAVHIKAFRGSKDGYLFFLETGILWGYKKPLMFVPLNRIASTSYTNILQRTFNIAFEVFADDGETTEEVEFSMLDQEDYGGIDDYIKQNRLQDRSMAEQRKAKLELTENRGPRKGAEAAESGDTAAKGEAVEGDMSELQKAQLEVEQQLQDDEDEDEEDYDPGSDASSEGSGDSSDDDDDDDDDDDEEEEDDDDEDAEGEDEDVNNNNNQEQDDAEGEEEQEEEEEEVAQPPVKQQPVKQVPIKQEPVKQAPMKSGWASIGSAPRANDSMDLDDEKFDIV